VLGRLFRVPTVFDFQGSMTAEMLDHGFLRQEDALYAPLLGIERWIDRAAPAILTSTANARKLLLEQFCCLEERVRVLPDAVNCDKFLPANCYEPAQLAALRGHYGIPEGRKLIVYLGLLAEYQGTGMLLESMARLLAQRDDAHLLLMGFPNVERYRQQAEALGIGNHVTFTGRVPYEQAPQMLALGDVAVSPKLSLTEGAGKVLNYMAVALPVVSFDTPVAREYLGSDGLYAPRGDVEAFAHRLEYVLFEKDTSQRMAEQGARLRQRALLHFRWDMMAQEIERVYGALLSGVEPFANEPRFAWGTPQDQATPGVPQGEHQRG
jgi:glycosyltransferase involved in cell wall biosynthesis